MANIFDAPLFTEKQNSRGKLDTGLGQYQYLILHPSFQPGIAKMYEGYLDLIRMALLQPGQDVLIDLLPDLGRKGTDIVEVQLQSVLSTGLS